MNINKGEFIEQLAVELGITKSEAERFANKFLEHICLQVGLGNRVTFSGFGQFSVSHREARTGVNPRRPTERIQIPAHNTPKFRAGDTFKQAVALK
jgi:DNA-binding protein HU-beta